MCLEKLLSRQEADAVSKSRSDINRCKKLTKKERQAEACSDIVIGRFTESYAKAGLVNYASTRDKVCKVYSVDKHGLRTEREGGRGPERERERERERVRERDRERETERGRERERERERDRQTDRQTERERERERERGVNG